MNCWICGELGESGEHLLKASDLKALFGHVNPDKPIYIHTNIRRNQKVSGLQAKRLKYRSRICHKCNNERTQPHDRSWEQLSEYLRSRKPTIRPGTTINLGRVFPGSIRASMLNVHLFFVKQFGCLVAENNIPLDITTFSKAILTNTSHPNIHIRFLTGFENSKHLLASRSAVQTVQLNGRVAFASWFYIVDRAAVSILYAEPFERRKALAQTWHPNTIGKYVKVHRYDA